MLPLVSHPSPLSTCKAILLLLTFKPPFPFSHFPIFPWILSFSQRPPVFYLNSFYVNDLTFSRPHVRPHVTPHLRPHLRPPVLLTLFCWFFWRSFISSASDNCFIKPFFRKLTPSPTWGLTWGLRWGVTWGVTWGLQKVNSLTTKELAKNTGGLRENKKIHGFHIEKLIFPLKKR